MANTMEFERYTDRARRVIVLAQDNAKALNHNYIGTEHILLGLVDEGEGVAHLALASLGVTAEVVKEQVHDIIGQGQSQPTSRIPFTPRAKQALELAHREAVQLNHNYIGTEHILLGLIREGEGVGSQVLVKLGCDLNRVRQQVIQLLAGYSSNGQTVAPSPVNGNGDPRDTEESPHVTVTIDRDEDGVIVEFSYRDSEIEILEVSVKFRSADGIVHITGQELPRQEKSKKTKPAPEPDAGGALASDEIEN